MELLRGIKALEFSLFLKGEKLCFEVEAKHYNGLKPFFERWGGRQALEELFFYMVNFVPKDNSPRAFNLIEKDKEYFKSLAPLIERDFSQLQGIKLNFGKGENTDVPPALVKYIGSLIEEAIRAEATDPTPETIEAKLNELKDLEKQQATKRLIQKDIPIVEAIIKAKNQNLELSKKDLALCTYAIFYANEYRLNFDGSQKEIEKETNPFDLEAFESEKVSKHVLRS